MKYASEVRYFRINLKANRASLERNMRAKRASLEWVCELSENSDMSDYDIIFDWTDTFV